MTASRIKTSLGLMSGTSMDGVDAAIIRTDGNLHLDFGPTGFLSYDPPFRDRLRGVLGQATGTTPELTLVEADLTARHLEAIRTLLAENGLTPADIDVIGFHGQTIAHAPERGLTRQIGDGALIARTMGVPVISDFRSADVAAGGQGAPFAPLYHAALIRQAGGAVTAPAAVLNLGGVGNVTWVGEATGVEDAVLAFDTGPGNALIDDWMMQTQGRPMDEGGVLAQTGRVDEGALAALLDHPYFQAPLPKSLDRDAFSLSPVQGLSPADGAATLVAFTVESVARGEALLPTSPDHWIVTGGGRKNKTLMAALEAWVSGRVITTEDVGWNGDAIEAQAFAYLAVRALNGQPLSVPGTTGVPQPMTGGVLFKP